MGIYLRQSTMTSGVKAIFPYKDVARYMLFPSSLDDHHGKLLILKKMAAYQSLLYLVQKPQGLQNGPEKLSSLSIYIFIPSRIVSKDHIYNSWWLSPRQGEIARGE
jgi:hypothetical protein